MPPPKRHKVLFIACDMMYRGEQSWEVISLLDSCVSLTSVFNHGFRSNGFKKAAMPMAVASVFQARTGKNEKYLLEVSFFILREAFPIRILDTQC